MKLVHSAEHKTEHPSADRYWTRYACGAAVLYDGVTRTAHETLRDRVTCGACLAVLKERDEAEGANTV